MVKYILLGAFLIFLVDVQFPFISHLLGFIDDVHSVKKGPSLIIHKTANSTSKKENQTKNFTSLIQPNKHEGNETSKDYDGEQCKSHNPHENRNNFIYEESILRESSSHEHEESSNNKTIKSQGQKDMQLQRIPDKVAQKDVDLSQKNTSSNKISNAQVIFTQINQKMITKIKKSSGI